MLSLQGLFAFIGIVFSFYVVHRLNATKAIALVTYPLAKWLWKFTDNVAFLGVFLLWIPFLVASTPLGKVAGFLPILALPTYFLFMLLAIIKAEKQYDSAQ